MDSEFEVSFLTILPPSFSWPLTGLILATTYQSNSIRLQELQSNYISKAPHSNSGFPVIQTHNRWLIDQLVSMFHFSCSVFLVQPGFYGKGQDVIYCPGGGLTVDPHRGPPSEDDFAFSKCGSLRNFFFLSCMRTRSPGPPDVWSQNGGCILKHILGFETKPRS